MKKSLYMVLAALIVVKTAYAAQPTRIQVHTQEEIDKYVQANPVVFLLVSAKWCPHCRALQPVVDKLSQELKNILFLDIDSENKSLARKYAPQVFPTMQIYKNGEVTETIEGTRSHDQLRDLMK
ncbi:MAG: thioredoxin family protein [Candidatus Babeliales bacterium]